MFNNAGGKCKVLAKVMCWLGIIGSVLLAIPCIVIGYQANAVVSGRGSGMILEGWLLLIIGPLGSWLWALVMHAVGDAAENSAKAAFMVDILAEKEHARNAPAQAALREASEWVCGKCGNKNHPGEYTCKFCNARRSFD